MTNREKLAAMSNGELGTLLSELGNYCLPWNGPDGECLKWRSCSTCYEVWLGREAQDVQVEPCDYWPPADAATLDALQRIYWAQVVIRKPECRKIEEGLKVIRDAYRKLPRYVAEKVTTIDREDLKRVTKMKKGSAPELVQALANDTAIDQVLEAVNVYRARKGIQPVRGRQDRKKEGKV